MGLYNFQQRFVQPIRRGTKQHTIRAKRKRPDKPGDVIHCYVGLRHKGARLLGRWPCVKVEDIWISATGAVVMIDRLCIYKDEKELLARSDGFKSFDEMMEFWDGRLPFEGHIIHWKRN
jgi:hypothetical protein